MEFILTEFAEKILNKDTNEYNINDNILKDIIGILAQKELNILRDEPCYTYGVTLKYARKDIILSLFYCYINNKNKEYFIKLVGKRKAKNIDFKKYIKLFSKIEKEIARETKKYFIENINKKLNTKLTFNKYKKLKEKAIKIARWLSLYYNPGYSMGSLYCVYLKGKNKHNKLLASESSTREYLGNRYKALHGFVSIALTPKEIEQCELINGVITIQFKNNKAKWLEATGQKQYYKLYWVDGYVFRGVHAKTLKEARALWIKKERAKRGSIPKSKLNKFFGIEHLKKIGACEAGIKNAARALKIDLNKIGGITVKEALNRTENHYMLSYIQRVANIL